MTEPTTPKPAQVVLEEVRRQSKRARRFDWRFPAALAAASLGLSVVISLVNATVQNASSVEVIEGLTEQLASAQEQLDRAEARADDAARSAGETQRLVEEVRDLAIGVEGILAEQQARSAERGQVVAGAVAQIRAGIAEEFAAINERGAEHQRMASQLDEVLDLLRQPPCAPGTPAPEPPPMGDG